VIQTIETAPSPLLQPFVKSYSLRQFNTAEEAVCRPVYALHEMYLTFYLDGKPPLPQNYLGTDGEKFVFGLQTCFQGLVNFQGYNRLFSIVFKPTGFFRLFGIPPTHFTDAVYGADTIFSRNMDRLQTQLQEAARFGQMVRYVEQLLLSYLFHSKAKDPHNSITATASLLLRNCGKTNIEWLAREANMSLKTFERAFTAQVGTGPKLFARIARFNTALDLKMAQANRDWTSIAHHCGYFDQVHFIKEFKSFAGDTPSRFFKTSPPPMEKVEQGEVPIGNTNNIVSKAAD